MALFAQTRFEHMQIFFVLCIFYKAHAARLYVSTLKQITQ